MWWGARCAGREARELGHVGQRQAQAARTRRIRGTHAEDPRLWRAGKGAHGERTWNMLRMLLTLDVSKFTGWLSAAAPCRVKKRVWGEVWDGSPRVCEAGREVRDA